MIKFIINANGASLFAMELEKLLVNGKIRALRQTKYPQRFESYYFIFLRLLFAVGWFAYITAMITDLFSDPSFLLNKDFFAI